MLFSSFILLASASTTFAWSHLFDRAPPGCIADNCLRAVTGTEPGQTQTRANRPSDCAAFLAYTVTPDIVTVTATASFTSSTTVQSLTTITSTTTASIFNAKRAATAFPSAIPAYASPCSGIARYSSACSCAGWLAATTVTLPASTTTTTIDATSIATIVELATQTAQATSTVIVAPACTQYPIANSGFETGNFNSWSYYNPIGGAGGSWSIVAGQDSTRGAYVAQVSLLNPDTSEYGGFAAVIQQTFDTCVGKPYTLTFQYQCIELSSGASVQVEVAGHWTPALTCSSADTWYTGSMTWTASSSTADLYFEAVQNGVTQAIFQFDNIVATLNQ